MLTIQLEELKSVDARDVKYILAARGNLNLRVEWIRWQLPLAHTVKANQHGHMNKKNKREQWYGQSVGLRWLRWKFGTGTNSSMHMDLLVVVIMFLSLRANCDVCISFVDLRTYL